MAAPFSTRVASPAWRREAIHWIAARLDQKIDDVQQPRIRPWSTQLRVRTGDKHWWLKANCPALAFEPGLHAVLSELLPDSFDSPVAIDAERGWLLTADRGPVWGAHSNPGLAQWCELAAAAARIQQQTPYGPAWRHLDVPDCSPPTVVDRFDRFLALLAGLDEHHPAHLAPGLRDRLDQRRPAVSAAAETLTASPLPTSWQHGDLHPWNVFQIDGGPRLFDLGDSQWAHPVEILCVPHDWIRDRTDFPWEPVLEAYADAWGQPVSRIAQDWAAARITQNVNRVQTWWGCLAEASADEWRHWGGALLHHLRGVLAP